MTQHYNSMQLDRQTTPTSQNKAGSQKEAFVNAWCSQHSEETIKEATGHNSDSPNDNPHRFLFR